MDAEYRQRWGWVPGDVPELPDRVRDNEESIRTVEDDVSSLESDVSSAKKGIWTLVIQLTVVIIGAAAAVLFGQVV